jgi:hypothetical protein
MTVDISPVVQAIVGLAALALSSIGSLVLMKLNQRLHLQISASQQDAFDSALRKALVYGATKATSEIAAKGWDHPEVHSEVVSTAMQQVVTAFPQALNDVGLSTDMNDPKNTETLTAALERALPGAMTEASKSPITPPAPAQMALAPAPTVVVNTVAAPIVEPTPTEQPASEQPTEK